MCLGSLGDEKAGSDWGKFCELFAPRLQSEVAHLDVPVLRFLTSESADFDEKDAN